MASTYRSPSVAEFNPQEYYTIGATSTLYGGTLSSALCSASIAVHNENPREAVFRETTNQNLLLLEDEQ